MKASLSRMLRSGIAMLIVLCMVAAVVPAAVFATDAKREEALGKVEDTLAQAKNGLINLYDLAIAYGPDMAMAVWAQWEAQGYVKAVEDHIADLEELATGRYGTYEAIALQLNEKLQALVETKNGLYTELDALNAELATKKAQLDAILGNVGSVTAPDFDIDVEYGEHVGTPENDCTVGGDSAQAELEKAIADLEHAIAVVEALIADVETDINNMIALVTEIGETIASIGVTVSDIVAAAQDLKVAFEEIAELMSNEGNITVEKFEAAFEAARTSALAAIEVLEVATHAFSVAKADVEKLVGKAIADLEKISVEKIENETLEILVALIAETDAVNDPSISAVIIAVLVANGYIEVDAEALATEIVNYINDEYGVVIEVVKEDMAILQAKIEAEIEAKYPEIEAQLKAEAAAQIAALEARKAALEAELNGYYEDLKNLPANATQAVRDQIQAQIDRVTGDLAAIDADIAHVNEHLKAALEIAYNNLVAEIKAQFAEAMAQLEQKLADLKAALMADLKNTLNELLNMGIEGLIDLLKLISKDLANATEDALIALADQMVALFNKMLFDATHGDVLAGMDLNYVALGDGTSDFAAVLAESLKGKAPVNFNFTNAAQAGNTISGVAATLPADVIGADVITISFGQTELIGKALVAAMNGENVDWVALVGEEVVPYVEEALEYVYAEIDAMNLDAKTATLVKAIAEGYAYGAAEYAINLPILINNIRKVNPTAEIVIVGMYNPLAEAKIEIPYVISMDLSAYTEIFNYLIDGVQAYGTGLGMIVNDVTYVDAREVEVENSVLGLLEIEALTKGDVSVLYPSANGDAYVAEQIMNALTVTVLGDANGDGVVDSYDAALIARYDIGLIGANDLNLSVCDFNEDGVVDSYDAALIARYDVGLLAA